MSDTICYQNGKISIHHCIFGYMCLYTVNDDLLYKLEIGDDPRDLGIFFVKGRGWSHLEEIRVSPEKQSKNLVEKALLAVNEGIIDPTLKIMLEGTKFQLSVWNALSTIAPGKTASYQEIAYQIGNGNAVRAVGTACGNNPIAIIIPCHRVIKSNGSIGEYRWGGAEIKNKLLMREKQSLK